MGTQSVLTPSGTRVGRLPARTGDPRRDAIAELRWAMSGRGLTVDKLVEMHVVRSLPLVGHAVAGVAPEAVPAIAFDALTRAVRDLGESVHARLLRAALGVDYAGRAKDLTGRRLEFIRAHNDEVRARAGRDYLGETTRAAYDVEQRMLETLVTLLGAAAAPARTGRVDSPSAWRDGWRMDLVDATCRFHGRALRSTDITEVLVAGRDGADEYQRAFWNDIDGGTPARLTVLEGGEVVDERPFGRPNYRIATIRLPMPLAAGDRHRVRIDIRYPRRRMSEPWFGMLAARQVASLDLRVAFDPAELPERAWAYQGLLPGCGPGDPDDGLPVGVDRLGYAHVRFPQIDLGLRYGIGWAWPD